MSRSTSLHDIAWHQVGAGTGDTYYVGECRTCPWRHENYSAMALLDRIGAHELGLS